LLRVLQLHLVLVLVSKPMSTSRATCAGNGSRSHRSSPGALAGPRIPGDAERDKELSAVK
jgi:hypothetical protein